MFRRTFCAAAVAFCMTVPAAGVRAAGPPTYAAYIVDVTGKLVGTATFIGVRGGGVQIHVDTMGLTPGVHGMHIHEIGSCNTLRNIAGEATPFGAAGPHFDPQSTGRHLGPDADGHAGDLPAIEASDEGHASMSYFAPKLSVLEGPSDIVGRAIVIHANPDNYTDTPMNGGSGPRVECGEIGPLRS